MTALLRFARAFVLGFCEMLVFSPGTASSRSACAAVPRPASFCWMVCLAVFSLGGLTHAEVCLPSRLPLLSPREWLGLFGCLQSCWSFCWAPLLRAQPARRFFALQPSVCLCASQFCCLSNLIEVCSPSRPQIPPTL